MPLGGSFRRGGWQRRAAVGRFAHWSRPEGSTQARRESIPIFWWADICSHGMYIEIYAPNILSNSFQRNPVCFIAKTARSLWIELYYYISPFFQPAATRRVSSNAGHIQVCKRFFHTTFLTISLSLFDQPARKCTHWRVPPPFTIFRSAHAW